mgnify:CR=1 FL=1
MERVVSFVEQVGPAVTRSLAQHACICIAVCACSIQLHPPCILIALAAGTCSSVCPQHIMSTAPIDKASTSRLNRMLVLSVTTSSLPFLMLSGTTTWGT